MVDAVADQVYQRVIQFFDHGLVQLGLGAGGLQIDLLAQFGGQIPYQPFELAEGGADRQHPHGEGGVAQLGDQPLHLLGYGDDVAVVFFIGGLGKVGLYRYQFAHQVHQIVQPLGWYPDREGAVLRDMLLTGLTHLFLFQQRRFHLGGGHDPLFYQQFAEPFLHREDLLHLHRGQITTLHQNLAQVLVVGVSFGGDGAGVVDQVDLQFAVVLHKDEDILQGIHAVGGGDDDVPVEVALLRHQIAQQRDGIQVGHDLATPQTAQFIQQVERVGAAQHNLGGRSEANPVGTLAGLALCSGRFVCFRLIGRRGGTLRQQGLQPGDDLLANSLIGRRSTGRGLQHGADLVAGLQGQVQQGAGDKQLAVAHLVEDRFHLVGKTGDVIKPEHGPRALDGMHGPEDAVDQVIVLGVFLQFQQRGFQFG